VPLVVDTDVVSFLYKRDTRITPNPLIPAYNEVDMSLTEIEAQLEHLTPDELRHLALRSWSAFVKREGHSEVFNECDEDDPFLLAALDRAVEDADSSRATGCTGDEIRERISQWTSK